jgi:hypothetical protein
MTHIPAPVACEQDQGPGTNVQRGIKYQATAERLTADEHGASDRWHNGISKSRDVARERRDSAASALVAAEGNLDKVGPNTHAWFKSSAAGATALANKRQGVADDDGVEPTPEPKVKQRRSNSVDEVIRKIAALYDGKSFIPWRDHQEQLDAIGLTPKQAKDRFYRTLKPRTSDASNTTKLGPFDDQEVTAITAAVEELRGQEDCPGYMDSLHFKSGVDRCKNSVRQYLYLRQKKKDEAEEKSNEPKPMPQVKIDSTVFQRNLQAVVEAELAKLEEQEPEKIKWNVIRTLLGNPHGVTNGILLRTYVCANWSSYHFKGNKAAGKVLITAQRAAVVAWLLDTTDTRTFQEFITASDAMRPKNGLGGWWHSHHHRSRPKRVFAAYVKGLDDETASRAPSWEEVKKAKGMK